MADETTRPNARKLREGIVTSAGMDKTAVVTVTTRKPASSLHSRIMASSGVLSPRRRPA